MARRFLRPKSEREQFGKEMGQIRRESERAIALEARRMARENQGFDPLWPEDQYQVGGQPSSGDPASQEGSDPSA